MYRIVLPLLFSISLLSTALNGCTCGRVPVVLANPSGEAITHGIKRSDNGPVYNTTSTFLAIRTLGSDIDEGKENRSHCSFVDEDREDNHLSLSGASRSICLRSLTVRSAFYLRNLYCQSNWEETNKYDDIRRNIKVGMIEHCWESILGNESDRTRRSKLPSSDSEHDGTAAARISSPFKIRLNTGEKNKKETLRSQPLAKKVDLLFATRKVKNNEILLPLSIAELYRYEIATPDLRIRPEQNGSLPGNTSDKSPYSLASSNVSQLRSTIEKVPYADPWVDLTGRWRPAQSITTQDLADYNEFLIVCCSDEISYWTRKLLTSSSIVYRQEFVVKQLDRGRIVEFVDIHPLASNVWNRTVVTITKSGNSSRDGVVNNSSSTGREKDVKLDRYQRYINRLKGPQGDPILVEAYWQKNGTVYTSLLRKECMDEARNCSDNNAWIETKRYLFSGEDRSETHQPTHGKKKKEMMVETIYHSTSYPAEDDTKRNIETGEQDQVKTTRMLWKWEQVN